jgi:hypothetical protein
MRSHRGWMVWLRRTLRSGTSVSLSRSDHDAGDEDQEYERDHVQKPAERSRRFEDWSPTTRLGPSMTVPWWTDFRGSGNIGIENQTLSLFSLVVVEQMTEDQGCFLSDQHHHGEGAL